MSVGAAREKVLVVDDDPLVRSILVRELASEFDVLAAGDYAEALVQMANADRLAAVVTDLEMPTAAGGVSVLFEALARFPHCGRVLVSGAALGERVEELLRGRLAHRVVAKPWKRGGVLAAARAAIGEAASV
jgi:CheY-like chemotaxis protein